MAMMNVSPRSENFGNIVGLRAERGPGLGGVRLAQKPGSGADFTFTKERGFQPTKAD